MIDKLFAFVVDVDVVLLLLLLLVTDVHSNNIYSNSKRALLCCINLSVRISTFRWIIVRSSLSNLFPHEIRLHRAVFILLRDFLLHAFPVRNLFLQRHFDRHRFQLFRSLFVFVQHLIRASV